MFSLDILSDWKGVGHRMEREMDFRRFCAAVGVLLPEEAVLSSAWRGYEAAKQAMEESGAAFDRLAAAQPQKEAAALCWCARIGWELRSFYEALGIPEQIFWDTMTDLGIWQRNYLEQSGKLGLGATAWLRKHLTGSVFRLGRLQFERDVFEGTGQVIPEGAAVLGVHIPQGLPLEASACEGSFQAAIPFFRKYFQLDPLGFTCCSWLLDPHLRELLPEESNILRFARRFTVYERQDDGAQAMERIFGLGRRPEEALPQTTALQKAAKAYLARGGSLGMGKGYCPIMK